MRASSSTNKIRIRSLELTNRPSNSEGVSNEFPHAANKGSKPSKQMVTFALNHTKQHETFLREVSCCFVDRSYQLMSEPLVLISSGEGLFPAATRFSPDAVDLKSEISGLTS